MVDCHEEGGKIVFSARRGSALLGMGAIVCKLYCLVLICVRLYRQVDSEVYITFLSDCVSHQRQGRVSFLTSLQSRVFGSFEPFGWRDSLLLVPAG